MCSVSFSLSLWSNNDLDCYHPSSPASPAHSMSGNYHQVRHCLVGRTKPIKINLHKRDAVAIETESRSSRLPFECDIALGDLCSTDALSFLNFVLSVYTVYRSILQRIPQHKNIRSTATFLLHQGGCAYSKVHRSNGTVRGSGLERRALQHPASFTPSSLIDYEYTQLHAHTTQSSC
jgi:hypothetical protein